VFLVYTDESGKEFKKDKNGTFRDGPCFLYGGLAVKAGKHHLIEDAFKAMCSEILGIRNIYEVEIHTGDIFYGRKEFEKLNFDRKKEFFREVLQLLAKFNVPMILGLVYKDSIILASELEKKASAIYAFFSALDSFLLQQEEYGIIIADELENDIKDINELLDKKNLFGKKGGIKLSFLLRRIYFEKLNRFEEYDFEPVIPLKYRFESQIYAVVDNIHYVSSKFSVFNQLSDIVLFLFNISLEFQESKNLLEEKRILFEAIQEDFVYFMGKTNSTISFLIHKENAFDALFLRAFPQWDFGYLMRTLKEKQANGT